MRDFLAWNLSLGRWGGVHVRLHVFFVLLAVLALHLAAAEGLLWYGATAVVVLLASVVAHEIGHCAAAHRVGGSADQVVLWPFGGLVQVHLAHDPRDELLTALFGPAVNLAVCLLAAAPLLLAEQESAAALFNPLLPPIGDATGLTLTVALQLVAWINWVLVLVNLLPAFPLDGARALRALLWPRFGLRTSAIYVARAARLSAILMVVAGWLIRESYAFATLPLMLLGIFLFFSARSETDRLQDHDTGDEPTLGYDFSEGYTSLERPLQAAPRGPGPLRRWIDSRREARELRRRQLELEEERRADEILARLHERGPDALTEEDRAVLARVSQRYRNRQRR